MTLLNK